MPDELELKSTSLARIPIRGLINEVNVHVGLSESQCQHRPVWPHHDVDKGGYRRERGDRTSGHRERERRRYGGRM
jgi:hypothetical protein